MGRSYRGDMPSPGPKNKTPPISGVLSTKRQAYCACATSVSF